MTDEQFSFAWRRGDTTAQIAEAAGIDVRNVQKRRIRLNLPSRRINNIWRGGRYGINYVTKRKQRDARP